MSEQTSTTTTTAGEPDQPAHRYTAELAAGIEQRWQQRWRSEGTFEAPNPAGPWADPESVAGREKLYILDMFPYPSGAGLHVGHPLGYIATDVYGRFQRMRGRNVLHALGYDAFGLPAEQYAMQTGAHPRATTEANIANMRRQLRRLGLAHDERRRRSHHRRRSSTAGRSGSSCRSSTPGTTADGPRAPGPIAELVGRVRRRPASGARTAAPWAALSAAERRRVVDDAPAGVPADAPVNWCPGLGTVLANEEVTAEGRSEIGNFPVFKRNLRQWMMRITAYADRLLADLDRLDWPDPVKHMQRNWIGRSRARGAVPDRGAATIRSSPPGPTRCSAPPTWCWPPSTRWSTR